MSGRTRDTGRPESKNPARKFTCSSCGLEFISQRSEEETRAEQKANGFADRECAVVCDVCYEAIMAWARKTGLHAQTNPN